MRWLWHWCSPIGLGFALIALVGTAKSTLAGSLEPPGTPAPTMRSMEQVTPSWDRVLPANDGPAGGCNSSRFTCVMGGAAVQDNETGLVWERSPAGLSNWFDAKLMCSGKNVGGRKGWRLPSIQEMTSLVDPSVVSPGPSLPPSHPFTILPNAYWAATSRDNADLAWYVQFVDGSVGFVSKLGSAFVLCVRGGGPLVSH